MAGMLATIDTRIGEVTVGNQGYRAAYPFFARAETQARQLGLVGAHVDARTRIADCLVWTEGHTLPGSNEVVTAEAVDRAVAETVELAGQSAVPSYVRYVLGNRAWLNGDDENARRLLMDSLQYMDGMVKVIPWWGVGRLLWVLQGADPDEAFGAADRLGHGINRAAWTYGQLSRAVSRCEPDQIRSYQASLGQAEGYLSGCDFLRQVLHTMMAPTLFRIDEELSTGWLREADAFCDAAGEYVLQRRVRKTMVELGVKVPRTGGGAVPPYLARLGLTARECEIHALLAAGATNAEIAERLMISVRTVESHVSNMLAKTGTTSRAELRSIANRIPTSR
ncbi:MAG: LuxR C-terminal-related transcriptional regulator [Microlunatus sp.]